MKTTIRNVPAPGLAGAALFILLNAQPAQPSLSKCGSKYRFICDNYVNNDRGLDLFSKNCLNAIIAES